MTFPTFIFYFFAAVLVFAALRVITARNPVHAALFLVLAFFTSAGIWIQLEAEFLAIALVLVYVGAVMVLFLFVVMMLDINIARLRAGFWNYLPVGGLVAALLVIEMGFILTHSYFGVGSDARPGTPAGDLQQHQRARDAAVYRLRLCVRDRGRDPARRDRRGDRAHPTPPQGHQVHRSGAADQRAARGSREDRLHADARSGSSHDLAFPLSRSRGDPLRDRRSSASS